MTDSLPPSEIYLHPGEYYFGNRDTRIRTILGSCISITFWHPRLLVGGMCHYMLPERHDINEAALDGRYADEAVALLLKKMDVIGLPYKEYQVKLFGGGNMFPESPKNKMLDIGTKNVQAARKLLKQHGFTCVASHLGGTGSRTVIFEVWSGDVWIKHCHCFSRHPLQPSIKK